MPALPLDEAGKYVAAVYIFFVILVLLYLGILSARIARLEKDAVEIGELLEERDKDGQPADKVPAP
jgi:hypothetical protein